MYLVHFKKHLLPIVLIPLFIIFIAASYYRFMVLYDYSVAYEIECDPYQSDCFEYCDDELCNEPFYYALIERSASIVVELCPAGDVSMCKAAHSCTEHEHSCVITYCEPQTEAGCESIEITDTAL